MSVFRDHADNVLRYRSAQNSGSSSSMLAPVHPVAELLFFWCILPPHVMVWLELMQPEASPLLLVAAVLLVPVSHAQPLRVQGVFFLPQCVAAPVYVLVLQQLPYEPRLLQPLVFIFYYYYYYYYYFFF